jgi:hypothetical protein
VISPGRQPSVRAPSGGAFDDPADLLRPVALTGIYKNMRRAIVALVFRCEIIGGTPTAGDEACQLAWLARALHRKKATAPAGATA